MGRASLVFSLPGRPQLNTGPARTMTGRAEKNWAHADLPYIQGLTQTENSAKQDRITSNKMKLFRTGAGQQLSQRPTIYVRIVSLRVAAACCNAISPNSHTGHNVTVPLRDLYYTILSATQHTHVMTSNARVEQLLQNLTKVVVGYRQL